MCHIVLQQYCAINVDLEHRAMAATRKTATRLDRFGTHSTSTLIIQSIMGHLAMTLNTSHLPRCGMNGLWFISGSSMDYSNWSFFNEI